MKRTIMFIIIIFILIFSLIYSIVIGSLIVSSQPVLVKNFVDLNDVKEISPFRSCQGHLVIPGNSDEPKSNMKHYFIQISKYDHTNNQLKVYAPFEGYVTNIMAPTDDNEGEIWIGPLRLPPFGQWNFILAHINILPSLKSGDKVYAGQLVGYASFTSHGNAFDVIYARNRLPTIIIDDYVSPYAELDSVFNHMAKEVLSEYLLKGITPEDLFISAEKREKNPCIYGTKPYFENNEQQQKEEWLRLK